MRTLRQIKWALIRLLIYFFTLINVLTFGLVAYSIAPYTSYFFFKDWKFWKYLPFFNRFYRSSLHYLKTLCRRDAWFFLSHLPLTDPPMMVPDKKYVRISVGWTFGEDTCGLCTNCCFLADCCFLDPTSHRCLSYGSVLWNYFNCGRFPSSKWQLEFYQCQKYEILDP
jgi:hypothetical protein